MTNKELTIPEKNQNLQKAELNNKQNAAIVLLIKGLNDQQIARQVGVTRQTVNYWRNQDADFIYMLNLRRQAIWERQRDKFIELVDKSTDIVLKNLDSQDPKLQLKVAQSVLRIPWLRGFMKPDKLLSRQEMENDLFHNAIGQAVREVTEELGIQKY
ncbi:MAG TPA: helix-turn-helix domain-containing protein [Anaerolineae bacterium]|nr:helix-turn-helix domain-containing protein [Anaerolineae bacterium]